MGKLITTLFLLSILTLVSLFVTYAEDIVPKFRGRTYRYHDLFLINIAVSVGLFIIRCIMIPFNTSNTVGSFETFFGYPVILFFLILLAAILMFTYHYVKDNGKNTGYLRLIITSFIAFLVFLILGSIMEANNTKHVADARPSSTVQKKKASKKTSSKKPAPKKETYLKQISTTNGNGIVDSNGKISYVYQTDKDANLSTDADAGQSSIDKISDSKYRVTLTLKDQNSNYVNIMADKKGQKQSEDEVSIYTQEGYNKLVKGNDSSYDKSSSDDSSDNNDSSDNDSDDDVPMEYQNALYTGEGYASEMNLSKQGVYDQLTSSYGEGFSADAANYAINHITDVDWNENALETARKYQSYMHMSLASIQEQLSSSAGEKFTPSEAAYAVQHLNY